ncbi:MAG: hypothetical protein JXA73_08060 [Acidobacteria bacterium]|nr:hypothetical protein [Acidobacteriota bacterium]
MSSQIYHVDKHREYQKAGPTDLIRLLPAPGANSLFLPKSLIEIVVYGIVNCEITHLSGQSGSAKSSLIEALFLEPVNFSLICRGLGYPEKPLKVHPIEMATFETPGELYQRRALKSGTTFDEESLLVNALMHCMESNGTFYALIWLREMGRVHSASVQGGLLDLMVRGDILLPNGSRVDGTKIAWVVDSNYQAESDAIHTLVTLDDALKRRFTINLTMDYLSAEQEYQVLEYLCSGGEWGKIERSLLKDVVHLGHAIRRSKSEGSLQSVPPPTIYGYLAFLRMAKTLPHLSLHQIALSTLLGNAGSDDRKAAALVFNQVFGLQGQDEEDSISLGKLF